MRFALSVASVLLLGSAAFAEEASPPPAPTPAPAPAPAAAAKKLPLRVVRVLEDTQQALLFDKVKGTHVLVETGKQIDGFTVTEIDEDSVTLTAEGGQQIVLAGPDPSWRGHRNGQKPAKSAAKAAAKTEAPEDPYGFAAPIDPYSDDEVRSVAAPDAPATTSAPIAAGEGGVRTAEAPVSGAPSESVRSAEAPGTPAKVVVSAAIPSSTIPTASTSTSPLPSTSTSTVTPTTTTTTTPIVSTAPVAEPVAAPSAEPTAPMDTSSSAAWSTTPVDPETAAIVGLFTDTKPATPTKAAPTAKSAKTTKTAKSAKSAKSIATAVPSVSATGTSAGTATAAAPADGATIIAKADVTAALGNFSALAGAVRGSFSADGAHLDAVAPDSLFAKAGLQAGDTVTAINNRPLRSLDDAATLYARAGSMKAATIQVVRAGKPLSLRLAIQ